MQKRFSTSGPSMHMALYCIEQHFCMFAIDASDSMLYSYIKSYTVRCILYIFSSRGWMQV